MSIFKPINLSITAQITNNFIWFLTLHVSDWLSLYSYLLLLWRISRHTFQIPWERELETKRADCIAVFPLTTDTTGPFWTNTGHTRTYGIQLKWTAAERQVPDAPNASSQSELITVVAFKVQPMRTEGHSKEMREKSKKQTRQSADELTFYYCVNHNFLFFPFHVGSSYCCCYASGLQRQPTALNSRFNGFNKLISIHCINSIKSSKEL